MISGIGLCIDIPDLREDVIAGSEEVGRDVEQRE